METIHHQIVAGYDATAQEYAQDAERYHAAHGEEARDFFVTSLKNGRRLLEVGCGAGQEAKWFADHGARVIAIDPSSELIRAAKNEPSDVDFRVGSLDSIQPSDGPFDGIWCNRVFQHLTPEERPAFLAKARSLLADDGLMYMSARVSDAQPEKGVIQFMPTFDISEKEVHNLLDCAGLVIERQAAWEDLPPWHECFLRKRQDKLNCDLNA